MKVATNFAARYQGFLIPPITGSYKFWIANESVSELWLSTDATPAKKIKIGEVTRSTPYVKWPHTHEAESVPVTLEAGRRYYLEVLQQQAVRLHATGRPLAVAQRRRGTSHARLPADAAGRGMVQTAIPFNHDRPSPMTKTDIREQTETTPAAARTTDQTPQPPAKERQRHFRPLRIPGPDRRTCALVLAL